MLCKIDWGEGGRAAAADTAVVYHLDLVLCCFSITNGYASHILFHVFLHYISVVNTIPCLLKTTGL